MSEHFPTEIPTEHLGPKLGALTPLQQRFAWHYACGLTATEAARAAGYSDVAEGCKVRGSELIRLEHVLDAVDECSVLVRRSLGPIAVQGARAILMNPKHPYHGRMIETMLDRTGHSAKTEHKVTVEHTLDTREIEELARRLALESGVPVERLLGTNKPMKVIEHEKPKEE